MHIYSLGCFNNQRFEHINFTVHKAAKPLLLIVVPAAAAATLLQHQPNYDTCNKLGEN